MKPHSANVPFTNSPFSKRVDYSNKNNTKTKPKSKPKRARSSSHQINSTHSTHSAPSLHNIPRSVSPSPSTHSLPEYPTYDPLWKPVAIIHGRYAMGPKIGSGSFGSVHAGVDLKDNYRYIAIKLEPVKPSHHPQLEREYKRG